MLVLDRRSGMSRGFGFIYYESIEDAQKALERTNGMRLDGRYIRVDFSLTKKPHDPTPGVYMGEVTQGRLPPRDMDRGAGYRGGPPRSMSYRSRSRSRSPARRARYSDRHDAREYPRRSRSRSPMRVERVRSRSPMRVDRGRSRSRSPPLRS